MNTLLRLSAMIIAASGVYATASEAADEETTSEATPTHMPAEIRSTIDKLVIIAGPTPEQQDITGSYEKVTPGLLGGMSEGSRLGTLSKEIGGVNVNFPVPILTLPGAIAGGISGKAQRDIQEFRDALTEDLAKAANQTLSNDGLALDIYRDLQRVEPKLDSHLFASTTPIDDATDAVLYAGITGVSFDIQEDDAILTTIAEATLRNASDGSDLYKKTFHYQDRD
ncbi:MAG: hypothetical protein KJO82_06865, partial [Gammaproteobacteria bacterium]|nr:hypothetical protein [Gammaproteobacteria bacterium]